ncbi:MAG: hypothetical protein C0609_08015 [Deltaproteobacteria bacterium]|nr:MAG: hypothetical protein C0609_08015 [Deltaproteobacteria bacterium]
MPIRELKAPGWSRFELFWIFLPLCALAVVRELIKRKNFLLALTFLFYASLAVRMVRFIPFPMAISFPYLYLFVVELSKKISSRVGWTRKIAIPSAIFLLLISVSYYAYRLERGRIYLPLGYGINEKVVPVGVCDFINDNGLKGKIFNEFDQGGYLAMTLYPAKSS